MRGEVEVVVGAGVEWAGWGWGFCVRADEGLGNGDEVVGCGRGGGSGWRGYGGYGVLFRLEERGDDQYVVIGDLTSGIHTATEKASANGSVISSEMKIP